MMLKQMFKAGDDEWGAGCFVEETDPLFINHPGLPCAIEK